MDEICSITFCNIPKQVITCFFGGSDTWDGVALSPGLLDLGHSCDSPVVERVQFDRVHSMEITLKADYVVDRKCFVVKIGLPLKSGYKNRLHYQGYDIEGFHDFVQNLSDPLEVGSMKIMINNPARLAQFREYLELVWHSFVQSPHFERHT